MTAAEQPLLVLCTVVSSRPTFFFFSFAFLRTSPFILGYQVPKGIMLSIILNRSIIDMQLLLTHTSDAFSFSCLSF